MGFRVAWRRRMTSLGSAGLGLRPPNRLRCGVANLGSGGPHGQPPDVSTSTMRYSSTSNWSAVVAVRVSAPVKPVLDAQVTAQFVVAVIGQVPVPPVRSFRDRQANLCPQGGSAFQS